MDIDVSNPVHLQVLRDLASYGVHIPCGLLRSGKDEKKKLVQIFTPKKTKTAYNANNRQNPDSRIFGLDLTEVPMVFTTEFGLVPKFLHDSFQILEKHLKVKGLFRQPGSRDRIRRLQEEIDANEAVTDCHPLDLASLIKQFFRELPGPLITQKVYAIIMECHKQLQDSSLLKKALTRSCLLLPMNNLNTLRCLTAFLTRVAKRSSENLMNTSNLALIFAPTLLHSETIATTERKVQGFTMVTKFTEVDTIQILIENWKDIGELPGAAVKNHEKEEESNILHGFGSGISPIKNRKRRHVECPQEAHVTFNVPEPAEESGWTSVANKRLKLSKANETNVSIRKKGFFKLFGKKRKTDDPLSLTMPERSIQHSTMGESIATKGRRQIWKKIFDKIRKPKNKDEVSLKGMFNVTNLGPSFFKENVAPESTLNEEEEDRPKNSQNSSCITELVLKKYQAYDLGDRYKTPDFRKCPITLNTSKCGDKLRKAERLLLEKQEKLGFTFLTSRARDDDLDDAELDDEDYDDDELDTAKLDIFDDSFEVSDLSDALVSGSYCGQSSKLKKPPTSFQITKTELVSEVHHPKTSLKSLDSGLGMTAPGSRQTIPGDHLTTSRTVSRQVDEVPKFNKSPMAITFRSRRALVFDPIHPFEMNL